MWSCAGALLANFIIYVKISVYSSSASPVMFPVSTVVSSKFLDKAQQALFTVPLIYFRIFSIYDMLFIAKKVKNEASPEKELKFHCKDCGRTLDNEGKNQIRITLPGNLSFVEDRKKPFKSKLGIRYYFFCCC